MRVFVKGDKTNFVDERNVIVGFDTEGACCEAFGWFVARHIILHHESADAIEPTETQLAPYRFDVRYFQRFDFTPLYPPYDEGGAVVFRLKREDYMDEGGYPENLFLHLVNSHNGYYAHGFTVEGLGDFKFSGDERL